MTTAGVTVLLLAAAIAIGAATPQGQLPDDLRPLPTWFVTPVYLLGLAGIGALIASRHPRNPIGWLMAGAAVLGALIQFGRAYAELSLVRGHPGFVGVEWLTWLSDWAWTPWLTLQMVYLPVLFPEGRFPSKRWAWLVWTASTTAVLSIASQALDPALLKAMHLRNPMGIQDAGRYLTWLAQTGTVVIILLGLLSLASVFARLKSASGDRREQLKWFGTAITAVVTLVAAQTVYELFLEGSSIWLEGLIGLAYLTIPVSIGFSVLRYHLYDIDVVLNRTLVYCTLATAISAVYVVAVVGVGAAVGGHVHLLVSLLAAGGVALAFQPARERLQRLANRVVYGRRATPYDALAVLSRQVGKTAPTQMLLNDMVRAACHALGVPSACFWLSSGEDVRPMAAWPPETSHPTPSTPSPSSPAGPPVCTLPVQHEGRLLGAISVTVPPGRSLSAADRRLLGDVANQLGLVFRNLGLTADLMSRVVELRESRRRLVSAQDEERRRLERDLHDGAQQHLFGIKVGIHEARALVHSDAVAASTALERLEEEADEALRTVRALARGVAPPLLTAQGLAAALNARARSTTTDVRVTADGAGRYPADVEAAVYFCCSEALQNAIRHAQASVVRIRLAQEGEELVFAVQDDGSGFDARRAPKGAGLQSMRDRVDVVGGTLDILVSPEGGTAVRGRVPCLPRQRGVPTARSNADLGLEARPSNGGAGPPALWPG